MGLSSPEMGRAHAPPYEEEAVATAERLQASSLPTGSRGRLAQASGKLMGKALAVLKFTVPHDLRYVDRQLERLQRAVDGLVLGRRREMRAEEARQPRAGFGIGMLSVREHMPH